MLISLCYLSIYESGVLNSLNIIVSGPICSFMSSSACFMKLATLKFGVCVCVCVCFVFYVYIYIYS
jgi:hypothetical protein